jgi:hypothetical protein
MKNRLLAAGFGGWKDQAANMKTLKRTMKQALACGISLK